MANSIQRQWNAVLAMGLQTGLGSPFSGAGANVFPVVTGRGNMTMDAIPSLQIRQDGMSVRGRHGTQKTKGSYKCEMQAGNFDPIMQSIMRGRFVAGSVSYGGSGSTLSNPAAGALVRDYWTVEEFEVDLSQSEVYLNCCPSMFELAMRPNGMIDFSWDWVGTGEVDGIAVANGNTVPQLSSPTYPLNNALPMAALNASVTLTDPNNLPGLVLDLTAFTLKVDLKTVAPPVAASRFSPDVFDGIMEVSGTMTIMRRDLVAFQDAINESDMRLELEAQIPGGLQKVKFTVPFFTLQQAEKSEFKRDGGPLNVVIPFPAAMVGVDTRGGVNPQAMIIIERNYA